MDSVAFEIFGMEIAWYGVIIGCGVILAFLVAYFNAKKKGLDFDLIIDVFLWAFPIGIIGARFYYVIFELDRFDTIWEMMNIRNGGLAIHGGLIFGLGTAYIVARKKKMNFLSYIDIVVPGIILAQAIGRWGNFMNQEAHGGEVSKEFISKFPQFIQDGMYIGGTYYHPTFLYESVWNILVFCILMFILYKVKKNQDGMVLGAYMALYSVGRFFIEGLRTDSLMVGGLRVAQLISLAGIIAGVGLIVWSTRRKNKEIS